MAFSCMCFKSCVDSFDGIGAESGRLDWTRIELLEVYEGKIVRPIKHSRDNNKLTGLINFQQWFDERASRKNVPRIRAQEN